ncbi:MAG: hypothetical protein OHK0023_10850 [Anaerolineae bacterium]
MFGNLPVLLYELATTTLRFYNFLQEFACSRLMNTCIDLEFYLKWSGNAEMSSGRGVSHAA